MNSTILNAKYYTRPKWKELEKVKNDYEDLNPIFYDRSRLEEESEWWDQQKIKY